MNNTAFKGDKYSLYCKEHSAEFSSELSNSASAALRGWFGRSGAILLALSTLINYSDALARGNPYAGYMLFTYAIPIILLALYPALTIASPVLNKRSPLVLDFLSFAGLMGFCAVLYIFFLGTTSEGDLQELSNSIIGQISFILMLGTAFSYKAVYLYTFLRNIIFTMTVAAATNAIGAVANQLYFILLVQGILGGTMVSWVFFDAVRTRFYLKSTDADTRQHLYNQLSKLVYPHQLERIKLGDELENTMPLKEGKAIINVFDVQKSGEIRHERTQDFFMGIFQSFLQICMKGYEHNPLRSRAFRLKETGDGFISAVGYPFLPVDSRSLADSAVATALTMFEAFNDEVEKFNYSRPIKGAMGLAYNSVQGTFQSGGIRSYDLFGDALIQAAKYEELRKQPVLWDIFCEHASEMGLKNFNILIVQEFVYNSLSPSYRELFTEIDLTDKRLVEKDFQLMYDNEAKYIYFQVLK
ncbi:MAG: hypothetical protein JKY86_08640 [Gammaproteobacteria bacterium]|nr:hypothetical protein [Gammaproteobacteria bacterium]